MTSIIRLLSLLMVLMWMTPAFALEEYAEGILHTAATAVNNGTTVVVNRYNTITLQTTITAVATLAFEGTVDGTTYVAVPCSLIADTTAVPVTSTTATGAYRCNVAGLLGFRARISAYTSGTVSATARATTAGGGGSGGGGGGTAMAAATAAAPTYTEGATAPLSVDLAGNVRVTMGTLLAGEDQANNLIMTSGGAARGSEGNIINSAVGDATSAAFTLPTGYKTLTGRITGAGSVAQVITIYGGTSSGMAAATSVVVCTITLSGTSGAAGTADACPPFIAPHLYYIAVTSGSSGTPTTILTASH